MQIAPFDLIADLAEDPNHGWSIGSFGAIGEFVRDQEEPVNIVRSAGRFELTTPRGAMRIAPETPLTGIAWDSLSSDDESWGHALAFCTGRPADAPRVIAARGPDANAIRAEDRNAALFDLGVGVGAVRMCVRTHDAALVSALTMAEGRPILSLTTIMTEMLRAQPHRVLLSPAGRIEVFQPIPPPDGKSPIGPHTHLLPKLIATNRAHSSNIPLPDGLQAALTVHPRSPWRTNLGERHPFDESADAAFLGLLETYGLPQDAAVREAVRAAVRSGAAPDHADWPDSRRGRIVARIMLRRMAAAGDELARPWRALYDRTPAEAEEHG